jgi:hypothetical protein
MLTMTDLPGIPELIQRTKALATLDLIMSPEWDYRYYSFNASWSRSEQMASMRNGSGDEWWLVFHAEGWAALKGLGHESEAWSAQGERLSAALQGVVPSDLGDFSKEPAFAWEYTSFAYFYLPSNERWCRANDLTAFATLDGGEDDLLYHLCGDPSDYATFAEDYYERTVPASAVAAVFDHKPITDELVLSLNPDTTLEEISNELHGEIGYPE